MIFRTYEHYPYTKEPNILLNNNYDVCFICFEQDSYINKLINLKDQTIFEHICNCNGIIHTKCIKKWYNIEQKCPICRRKYIMKTSIDLYNPTNNYLMCWCVLCFPSLIIDIVAIFVIIKITNFFLSVLSHNKI